MSLINQNTIDGFGNPLFATTRSVKQIVNGSITPGSVVVGNLTPNLPVKSDATNKLVSGLISETDLNFSVISNPITSGNLTISAGNLIAVDVITDESPTGINSFITGTEISIDNLQLGKVAKSGDTMTGNLAMSGNSITGVSILNTDEIHESTLGSNINLANDLHTNNIIVTGGNEIKTNNIGEASAGGGMNILSNVDMNTNSLTNVNNLSTTTISAKNGVSISLLDDFDVNNYDLLNCANVKVTNIEGIGAADVTVSSNINMNTNDITNVASINRLTPVGGMYAGISDGTTITQAMGASDLLPVSSVGGLLIPANGFSVGDSFHLVCSGIFPSENKNDDVEIELRAVLADTSVVVLGSILIALENFNTRPSNFELESDFVIRSIGVTGKVAVSFDFTFNKKITEDFKGTRKTNLATLDTTQSSRLSLNATIIGVSGSTIKSTLAYLRKQY